MTGALFIALLTGCSSSMMKATPFYSGKMIAGLTNSGNIVPWNDPEAVEIKELDFDSKAKKLDADRTNIWPFYYDNYMLTSIFWPVGEINDVGWEVRPLLSVDNYNESYKYFFCFGGYNGKNGNSYFFPLYKNGENSFYTPLFGWNPKLMYALPPAFIMNKNKDVARYNIMWPLCSVSSLKDGVYSFPLFYLRCSPDKENWTFNYLMPLGWMWRHENRWLCAFLPLFYFTCGDSGVSNLFTPVFALYDSGKSYWILPPLFIRNKYARHVCYEFLWPFAKLKVQNKKEDGVADYQGYFFPFFEYWRKPNYFRLGAMWPLFLIENKNKRQVKRFLPFFYSWSNLEYTQKIYMMFLGNSEWNLNGKKYEASFVLPFYYKEWFCRCRSTNVKTMKTEYLMEKISWFFPNVYISDYEKRDRHRFSLFPFYFYKRNGSEISESSFLWLYASHENTAEKYVRSQAFWYIYFHESQEKTKTKETLFTTRVLGELYHSEETENEYNVNIFPFISYSKNEERKKFSFCWRLFSVEKGKEREKAYFLFVPVWSS